MRYVIIALLLTGCVSDCHFKPTLYIEETIGGSATNTIYEQIDGYIDGGTAAVQCKHDIGARL